MTRVSPAPRAILLAVAAAAALGAACRRPAPPPGAPGVAGQSASFLPLAPGVTWSYSSDKRGRLTAGPEVREWVKTGTIEERVIGPSPLSTAARPVSEVRRTLEERGSSVAPVVRLEGGLHLSAGPSDIWLHAVSLEGRPPLVFDEPRAVLTDPPRVEPVVVEEGPMRFAVSVRGQEIEAVAVPAGSYPQALKVRSEGVVTGRMGDVAIRSGTIRLTVWFAPGVGVVREDRVLDLTLEAGGTTAQATEQSTKLLRRFSRPAQ